MLLSVYTTGKEGELQAVPSLYDATPLFYINMPDGEKAPVFNFKNFPFEIFKNAPVRYKRGKTIDKVGYYDLAVSFDIETSTIEDAEKPFAFMYQWQYCIEDYVFMGKTWSEFQQLNEILSNILELGIKQQEGELIGLSLVCYIFNLSFEFTFMYSFIGELVSPLFTDVYAPLIVPTAAGITYRCAYRLTNKSLEAFTKGMRHAKLAGDLDYSIIRTPIYDNPKNGLTDLELAYCYNDVKGLSEALRDRFIKDPKYNIATIPLTSTGYVRKDCRNSMRKDPKCKAKFQETRLTPHLYKLCRMAFRGGNTHGNNKAVGKLIDYKKYGLIRHKDITSSYPAQMQKRIFPRTPFEQVPYDSLGKNMGNLRKLSEVYCYLIKFIIYDAEYIGSCGVPYISKAKSFTRMQDKELIKEDNGRIYSAPVIMVCMTEIDALITLQEYKYSKIEVLEAYRSKKGFLPYELRRVAMDYYKKKTLLKGCTDPMDLYEYARTKELLNAIYGLMCMRIDRITFNFNNGEYIPTLRPLEEMLNEFYESDSSFLPYQYALYITSAARLSLYEGCKICGPDLIYIDTDSVFYVGNHEKEFEKLNAKIEKEALKHNAIAYNKNGEAFPLGVWTSEADCKYFKTLGAKKYLLSEDGETIQATISGVSKKIGKDYFTKHGFDAFTDRTCIPVSGKVSAHYNREEPHIITINGVEILTASNIALISSSYTFKIKDDYKNFLKYINDSLKQSRKE